LLYCVEKDRQSVAAVHRLLREQSLPLRPWVGIGYGPHVRYRTEKLRAFVVFLEMRDQVQTRARVGDRRLCAREESIHSQPVANQIATPARREQGGAAGGSGLDLV